ncbi:MAG: hypothetical protein ACK515_03415 [bacterium]|jgi:hypothetical protein|nr:hypothetical protein [Betaproteobacteria bacterium]
MDLKLGEFPMATLSREITPYQMSRSEQKELTELLGFDHSLSESDVHPLVRVALVLGTHSGTHSVLAELTKNRAKDYSRAMKRIEAHCKSLIDELQGTAGFVKFSLADDAMVEEAQKCLARLRESAERTRAIYAGIDARGRPTNHALRMTISDLADIFDAYAKWPPDPLGTKPYKRRHSRAQKQLQFVRKALDFAKIKYSVGNNAAEKSLLPLFPDRLKSPRMKKNP